MCVPVPILEFQGSGPDAELLPQGSLLFMGGAEEEEGGPQGSTGAAGLGAAPVRRGRAGDGEGSPVKHLLS